MSVQKQYLVMDESDAPIKDYKFTDEEKLATLKIMLDSGLEVDESSELYKLGKERGYIVG